MKWKGFNPDVITCTPYGQAQKWETSVADKDNLAIAQFLQKACNFHFGLSAINGASSCIS